MRVPSLTLLPLLLLASQVLSGEGKKEAKNRRVSKATADKTEISGKPQAEQKSQPPKHLTKGKFVTQDQADCRWVVTEKDAGVDLKVECTRQDDKFSCFFSGDPTSCLASSKKSPYWKQISRSLRSQKAICGDPRSVLKTRVCRKKFPESNLRLANSTLIGKKPRQQSAEPSRGEQSTVNEASVPEPNKVRQLSVKEPVTARANTRSGPTESKTVTSNDAECAGDPDGLSPKNAALDYCGDSWSSFCKFFITMVQSDAC